MSPSSHPTTAYKILLAEQWQSLCESNPPTNETEPLTRMTKPLTRETTPLDKNDGYIHMSTAQQAFATYEKYFKGKDGIVLMEVDLTKVDDIRWEESRDRQLFPHCYDKVTVEAVKGVTENATASYMEALVKG